MEKGKKIRRKERNSAAYTGERRWSAIDTVILILILLAVTGLVLRVVMAYRESTNAHGGETVYYDVYYEIDEVYAAALDEINGADAVYLYDTGELLGYVGVDNQTEGTSEGTSADTTSEESLGATADASPRLPKKLYVHPRVEGTDPDVVSAEGVICTQGQLIDGSLLTENSGIYLAKGTRLTVCTERVLLHIRVTGIVERQGEN